MGRGKEVKFMESLAYTKTRFYTFCDWWITGLAYLIPDAMQRLIDPLTDYITIEFNEENVTFKRYRDDSPSQLDERYFLMANDEMQKTATLNWLNEQRLKGAEIFLLIPANKVLQKSISLPLATEDNLRQVLGFEMDRRTPFTVDQVYFDYLIEKKDVGKNQLHVQLFATPKDTTDLLLKALNSWGIEPNAISIKDNIKNLNLLPIEQQSLKGNRQENKLTLILATVAFCLFMAVFYLPLLKQEHALNKLEKEVTESRAIAVKVKDLKEKKNKILERSSFLISKRNDNTPVIEIIDELTQLIPDDTWLTRFAITKGEIQLQGESNSASSMIHTIESSDNFTEARFRSPVTRNNLSKKDKFNLTAKLIQ